MQNSKSVDVRRDQLKILKLERKVMRPLATTLLSANAGRKNKLAALAAAAAAITALNTAPQDFMTKVAPSTQYVSQAAIVQAQAAVDHLATLVVDGAERADLFQGLTDLFVVIDNEHAKFLKFAEDAGARLLNASGDGVGDPLGAGSGGGNCESMLNWLATDDGVGDPLGAGSGGGNCESMVNWLANGEDVGDPLGAGSGGGNCESMVGWLMHSKM